MASTAAVPPAAPMARNPTPVVRAATPAPAAASTAIPLSLPAGVQGSYDAQRQLANETYQRGLAVDTNAEDLARQGYVQQFANLANQYQLNRNQLPFNWNARGMLQGGGFHDALQQLAQQHLQTFGGLQNAEAQRMSQFQTSMQNLLQQRNAQLMNIELQRQAAIAQLGLGSIK